MPGGELRMGKIPKPATIPIQRIVVGLDGSASSNAALRWAVDVAKGLGAHITAVHALDLPDDYPPTDTKFHDGWRRSIKAQFENVWCKPLARARVRYRAVMAEGRAASAIARVANQSNADLIVVGRRGRSGIAQLILGSVSHELVMRSRLPVLVLGPEAVVKHRVDSKGTEVEKSPRSRQSVSASPIRR